MSLLTVEVDIEHGKLTAKEPHLLPEKGHGLRTVIGTADEAESPTFSIVTGPDGLPVIRANGGVISSALVRDTNYTGNQSRHSWFDARNNAAK